MNSTLQDKMRHLLVVQDLKGKRKIPLEISTYSLGRDSRNSIVLHSNLISRQHAILLRLTAPETEQHTFRIVDGDLKGQKSTNGLHVNGQKCAFHDLKPGDVIEFCCQVQATYYTFASSLSDEEYKASCNSPDNLDDLSFLRHSTETLTDPRLSAEGAAESALARLATFPELSPNPIIEIDLSGTTTYLNPAAIEAFPNLKPLGLHHPLLSGLSSRLMRQKQKSLVDRIELNGRIYERSIHWLAEGGLIRLFIHDITRIQVDSTLVQLNKTTLTQTGDVTPSNDLVIPSSKTSQSSSDAADSAQNAIPTEDKLLQAAAQATNILLTQQASSPQSAINQALAILGSVVKGDHIMIFENCHHPTTKEQAICPRFQWSSSALVSIPFAVGDRPYSYRSLQLTRWYDILATGQTINCAIDTLPPSEQEVYQSEGVRSLYVRPLQIGKRFWGYLNIFDFTSSQSWSGQEQAAISIVLASISGVLQQQNACPSEDVTPPSNPEMAGIELQSGDLRQLKNFRGF